MHTIFIMNMIYTVQRSIVIYTDDYIVLYIVRWWERNKIWKWVQDRNKTLQSSTEYGTNPEIQQGHITRYLLKSGFSWGSEGRKRKALNLLSFALDWSGSNGLEGLQCWERCRISRENTKLNIFLNSNPFFFKKVLCCCS